MVAISLALATTFVILFGNPLAACRKKADITEFQWIFERVFWKGSATMDSNAQTGDPERSA